MLHPDLKDADLHTILKKAIELGDLIVPVKRTVHPIPDLRTYIPEEYYEPLASHDFQIKVDDPLSPYEELQKYHAKKGKKASLVVWFYLLNGFWSYFINLLNIQSIDEITPNIKWKYDKNKK